ncbi:MAG TPA: hypothetical protein PKH54_07385, partial [Myxococcota bacterium]|nr:hypothetical protein [Myxococcota bacterium]
VAASIMLMYLTDPTQGFEPWKPKELAELFSGYKFEGLGDIESVKDLKKQIKRSGNSYTYVSRDWVVFPAEPYCCVDVRTFCGGEYYPDENFDPTEDDSPENGPWVKEIDAQTDEPEAERKSCS